MDDLSNEAQSPASDADKDDFGLELILAYTTVRGFTQYALLAKNYLEVAKLENLRLVVLETWLFVDYTIRELLVSGLSLPNVDQDELNLREGLLPSFMRCLNLVTKIRDVNLKLQRRDPRIRLTGGMLVYLRKHKPELLDALGVVERDYRESIGLPPDDPSVVVVTSMEVSNSRWVSDAWLEVTNRIDNGWKTKAEKLDRARNKAAHSHDESAIAAKLGFSGSDALKSARTECYRIAGELLGVSENSTWIDEALKDD